MQNKWIKIETISDKISTLTLQRPEMHNALHLEMILELHEAIKNLEKTSCSVVILKAAGTTFCSGLDLKQISDDTLIETVSTKLAALFQQMHETPLVTIASLQGNAMGGGGGLAASCDFMLIAKEVKIGFPETRRGMVAAQVATILTGQVSSRHIRELLLRGEPIDSQRAIEIGLANRVVNPDELQEESLRYAYDIVKGGPQAIKATKGLLRQLEPTDFADDLQYVLSVYRDVRASEEAKEGIASFLEKRPPAWNM